ncbi:helix-turn-helix domain-containing protein [Egicoccus sp. AB-alg2]|uniref:helix-turn-helix domain-containing protein n=1 Tax=Egicoccus sp. AB-alg2 TaxID=3242693 RepID=UPI00359D912F
MDTPTLDDPYALALGERLRRVRQQQRLSLHDVEARSAGELKASVLGAYERGERAVSISRLHLMAQFFRVPVSELLPEPRGGAGASAADADNDGISLDLVALDQIRDDEPALARYIDAIKARRGDYNGQVLTIRGGDLELLAAVLGASADELRTRLTTAGLVR